MELGVCLFVGPSSTAAVKAVEGAGLRVCTVDRVVPRPPVRADGHGSPTPSPADTTNLGFQRLSLGWGLDALTILHLAGSFKSQHSRNPNWMLEYQNPMWRSSL